MNSFLEKKISSMSYKDTNFIFSYNKMRGLWVLLFTRYLPEKYNQVLDYENICVFSWL